MFITPDFLGADIYRFPGGGVFSYSAVPVIDQYRSDQYRYNTDKKTLPRNSFRKVTCSGLIFLVSFTILEPIRLSVSEDFY
jgi:hypothetical protein